MPTVVTRTIGVGRDYANFTTAEADVENIATSAIGGTDLVANDGAIVFEADAGTYSDPLNSNSSLVTDATRNVTYKPAAGSEHGGSAGAGVIIDTGGSNRPITLTDDFTIVDGFNLVTTTTYCAWLEGAGAVAQGCIASAFNRGFIIIGGTATDPAEVRNCVSLGGSGYAFYVLSTASQDAHGRIINCTGETTTSNTVFRNQQSGGGTPPEAEFVNCLSLGGSTYSESGTVNTTGSNNFGGSTSPFPVALQGSPYPITASKSYDPGAGDFALYVGSTGELLDSPNNDVVNQGVGPASNSDVPTTDILGNTRSGTTANPGAFEQLNSLTTVTRTIGSGKDYATFSLAEADIVDIATSAIGSGNLLDYNGAIVFEADAGDYTENFAFLTPGSLTCDPTRNVTWTHASGAGHGGEFESGVNIVGACTIQESFAVVDGLSVSPPTGLATQVTNGVDGVILRNLMSAATNGNSIRLSRGGTASNPGVVENCVAKSDSTRAFDIRSDGQAESHWRIVNCTAMATGINQGFIVGQSSSGNTIYLELVNNVVNGGTARSYYGFAGVTILVTGSNNFGPDDGSAPFPTLVQGSPYPITPTASYSQALESGDYAVFMGATGALADVSGNDVWQQGVGPKSNSDVPTTDIKGVARSGNTANPGAFEADGYVAPTVVTKTVGTGKEYTNVLLAEAAIDTIANTEFGGASLTKNNGALIFEIDAGTYVGDVVFSTSSVDDSDATRNVTWTCASGASHNGISRSGVVISTTTCVRGSDYHNTFSGIEFLFTTGGLSTYDGIGATFENCLFTMESGVGFGVFVTNNSFVNPARFKNCVTRAEGTSGGDRRGLVLSQNVTSGRMELINCTGISQDAAFIPFWVQAFSGGIAQYHLVNCLSLCNLSLYDNGNSGVVVTGSNNFGGLTAPFPAALQGSPYPVTASKSYDPGSGDFALYVGSTGELLNSPNNDVVGQGVGPTANEDVPTTDILGNTRSGATANPGAFELLNTTKIVTRTIGVGQNYETFRDAINDLENIATSAIGGTNILDYNGAIVFNIASGQYTDSTDLYIDTSLVSDRTRNVTFKAADGHEHGGKLNAGVIYSITGGTYAFRIRDSYVVLQDIHIKQNLAVNKRGIEIHPGNGNEAREGGHINRVIVTVQGTGPGVELNRTGWGTASNPLLITNCYFMNARLNIFAQNTNSAKSDNHVKIINCTSNSRGGHNGNLVYPFASTGQTLNLTMTNNVVLPNFSQRDGTNMDNSEAAGTLNWYGTNNYAVGYSMDADDTFPVAQRGSIYPITPIRNTYNTLSASGDEVVVSFGNGQLVNVPGNAVWNRGSGPDSDSDVPTVDIGGNPRTGTATNPGAYNTDLVIPSTKTVIEKSVDAGGDGQYTTPALAEADMRNIMVSATGSNDMFEANAQLDISIGGGAYSPFDFAYDRESQANLYSGPENLITFSALNLNDRPRFFGTDIGIRSDFLVVDGFDSDGGVTDPAIKFFTGGTGVKISRSTLKSAAVVAYVAVNGDRATAEHPVVFENCEFKSTGTNRTECIYGGGTGQDYDHYYKIINCQANPDDCTGQLSDSFIRLTGAHNGYIIAYNNLNLRNGSNDIELGTLRAGGDFFLSGSNNVGSVDNSFLRRFSTFGLGNIQGSATTNTDPGVGSTYLIYDASTNKLVDSVFNAAWKQGEGPSLNSEVDVFDIEGRTRAVYDGLTLTGYDRVNPGAYEVDTDFWTPPTAPAVIPPATGADQDFKVNLVDSDISTDWNAEDAESRNRYYTTRENDIRKQIFKMTQAKQNISFVYKESLRSMIASFNDLGYISAEDKFKEVKCLHANAERAIAKLKQEDNIILPMVTITQTTTANDDARRRQESVLVNEKYWDAEKNRAFRVLSLAPRPVNINYQVNVWCKYMADMDQILEQIRLKFNPEMNVPTEFSTIAKAFLDTEEDVGSITAGDKEDRIIKKTFNVVLRTYVPNPKFLVTSTGKIEELNINTQ